MSLEVTSCCYDIERCQEWLSNLSPGGEESSVVQRQGRAGGGLGYGDRATNNLHSGKQTLSVCAVLEEGEEEGSLSAGFSKIVGCSCDRSLEGEKEEERVNTGMKKGSLRRKRLTSNDPSLDVEVSVPQ